MPSRKRDWVLRRSDDKRELEYANQLPILWARFPAIDSEIVRQVWEQASDADEALAMLRRLQPSASVARRALPDSGASSGQGSACEWSCEVCTLLNNLSQLSCGACETRRPDAAAASRAGARAPTGQGAVTDAAASGQAGALRAADAHVPASQGATSRTGLDASFMRQLPHDALVAVLGLLHVDDTIRLASTCWELRDLVGRMPVRSIKLSTRHARWGDQRVLGLLRHIRDLSQITISCAVPFHSFGALATLPRAQQLVALSISSPLLVDAHLEGWAVAFPALRELRLPACDLSAGCAAHLVAFAQLRVLDVSSNLKLDTRTASALMAGGRQLRTLDLSHLRRVDRGISASAIAAGVRELVFKGFPLEAATLGRPWARLESLSMQESALVQATFNLPALRSLSLAGSKALARVELACGSLASLSLASCTQLERVEAARCSALSVLNLCMCRKLDAECVTTLVGQCATTLTRASLNGLTRVREEPMWLTSASAFRGHVGNQLQFVDLQGSCAAPAAEALFDRTPAETRSLSRAAAAAQAADSRS